MTNRYETAVWNVTTEGDEEGRSTDNLGTWQGPIDEIAFHLADKCYYVLEFELVKPRHQPQLLPKREEVHIRIHGDETKSVIREALEGRDVIAKDGQFWRSTKITAGPSYQQKKHLALVESAKEKLTTEELQALRDVWMSS